MTEIFVFGSNLKGIHKKGAAREALKNHGAIMWEGQGIQGSSYAIPTKETPAISMPLFKINFFVSRFIWFASINTNYTYNVTAIGCGLAGYKPEQIAPMFQLTKSLPHVKLPKEFIEFIPELLNQPERIAVFNGF